MLYVTNLKIGCKICFRYERFGGPKEIRRFKRFYSREASPVINLPLKIMFCFFNPTTTMRLLAIAVFLLSRLVPVCVSFVTFSYICFQMAPNWPHRTRDSTDDGAISLGGGRRQKSRR